MYDFTFSILFCPQDSLEYLPSQLTFMAVLYAEHNRNIPHGNVVRAYFILSFIARVTNLASIIGLQENVCHKNSR